MIGRFEAGRHYLVFRGAFHPKGYEELTEGGSAWLERVRDLVRSRN
jgi:hypothetical protein